MFGSVNMNPDYTFTQTETRLFSNNISKAASAYVGAGFSRKANSEQVVSTSKKSEGADLKVKSANEEQSVELKSKSDPDADILIGSKSAKDSVEVSYGDSAGITASLSYLSAAAGGNGSKVSKAQLYSLLESVLDKSSQDSSYVNEIVFIKKILAKFDTLSGGAEYITSLEGIDEPQDYTTITKEQVTSPIDIRIL